MKTIIIVSLMLITGLNAIEEKHYPKETIPAVHYFKFTESEIKAALLAYMKSKDIEIPKGIPQMSGLDNKTVYSYSGDGKMIYSPGITLKIEENEKK